MLRLAALLALVSGCAAAPPPPTRASGGDLTDALTAWTRGQSEPARSRTLRREPPRSLEHTVRIRRPVGHLERRGPRVDVHLERARLSNALRLLANAADLSIVIGEGLDSEITVDLRRIRPVAAMRAIARAHRVELSVVDGVVVARRPNR